MALPIETDSLESVDEAARGFYQQTEDGKYRLDLDGYEDPKGLKSALEKERQAAREASKQLKDFQKRYDGIDPDEAKQLMTVFETNEEAKLIAQGKTDDVIQRRMEKQRKEFEKQLEAANQKAQLEAEKARKFEQRVLDSHIMAAASKAGIHQHAIDDALLRARSMFRLNDDGNAVQFDDDGHVVLGKDGKTPFSPNEWLEGMKESAPHWFPAGNSGGGGGGNSNKGKQKTITRSQFESMPLHERSSALKGGVILTD